MTPLTRGTLLGGRVAFAQPEAGFRSGIEPVLLAAAVPARPDQRVIEGGSGAGAGLLCLAARVAGVAGLGIEVDPDLAAIAQANADANGFSNLRFAEADATAPPAPGAGLFDHAFANPPYHRGGTPSPSAARERAKRGGPDALERWIAALAGRLAPRGTLTLIVAAAGLDACVPAFAAAACGSLVIFPLWPRAGRPAKLALVQGVLGGKGAARLLAGLTLHEADGAFTPAAQAVLRGGAALDL